GDPENNAASTLIPGLLLTEVRHKFKNKTSPDVVAARIDDRPETRLPISLDKANKDPVLLDVTTDGVLKLGAAAKKKTNLAFTYKYLSPGTITDLALNETGGFDWEGTIKPGVPLLGTLGVKYSQGALTVTKGLKEEDLKKLSVLGMRVTKAAIE